MIKYSSRKFIAAIVVIVIATIFCWYDKIGSSEWIAAVNISLGLYIGGNVKQKGDEKNKKN